MSAKPTVGKVNERESAVARRVRVLLPLPLRGAYDYAVPPELVIDPGDFVRVPLGNRERVGVVWGPGTGEVGDEKLKFVISRLDTPPMPAVHRRFIDWVAAYTISSAGSVLRMAMSIPEALDPARPETALCRAEPLPDVRITAARTRVLEALAGGLTLRPVELQAAASVGSSVIKGMVDAGSLKTVALAREPSFQNPDPEAGEVVLSPRQAKAADTLVDAVAKRRFATVLLEGVTGSGKTEVYFEAVAEALRKGQQSLVLLPEIALSAQWLDRFHRRFGVEPTVWHSDLSRKERRIAWRAAAVGDARVVVGARSALFLPFPDLGLIVVDEEHDTSFKQEDGVVYHARDMAVVRAHLGEIPIVLASATPSLETLVNVEGGRYERVGLPERHGGATLPEARLIDMRAYPPPSGRWLSPPLAAAIEQTLEAGEQVMVYLNRRGYAPLTLCRACGHRLQCPNCTTWLVEHRLARRLACHHCGYSAASPDACPECSATDSLVACGPGVERVAEEISASFPSARPAIMASDTVHGPAAAAELVRAMQTREIDILIGTQIMAKGHHFPWLTLVGIVDADLGLSGGDLRAAERTWQLLNQVAGRAGRAERPGRVMVQSWMPEHPVLSALAANDRDRFLEEELVGRQAYAMPPFGRLAAVIVSGRAEAAVNTVARQLAGSAPRRTDLTILGPAPAPLAVLRGHHRVRFLLKTRRDANIQALVRSWIAKVRPPASVRIKVDVDPYSFL